MTTQLTGFKQDHIGSWIEKDPTASLVYTLDWTDWLYGNDTLVDTHWSIDPISGDPAPTTLILQAFGYTTGKSYATISGGTPGEIYTLNVEVTTGNGLIDSRSFRIKINKRYL